MRSWGSYLFHVGLFISQMNRCHPLPLILPQMLLKTRKEKKGEMFGVNEHMVHAVFKRVQASETTSVVL